MRRLTITERVQQLIGNRRIVASICGGLVLLIAAIVVLGSFKAVAPSHVCVVQEGGPLGGPAWPRCASPPAV